jgi:hypothetical protein
MKKDPTNVPHDLHTKPQAETSRDAIGTITEALVDLNKQKEAEESEEDSVSWNARLVFHPAPFFNRACIESTLVNHVWKIPKI